MWQHILLLLSWLRSKQRHHRLRGITATSVSCGKMETLTPCKIESLEQIDNYLSGLITSTRQMFVPHLVKIRSRGFWANGWNITFCVTFIYLFIFFSDQRREETPGRIWRAMAQRTWNRARMCLLGVIKWKIEIWRILKKWPWISCQNDETWNSKYKMY